MVESGMIRVCYYTDNTTSNKYTYFFGVCDNQFTWKLLSKMSYIRFSNLILFLIFDFLVRYQHNHKIDREIHQNKGWNVVLLTLPCVLPIAIIPCHRNITLFRQSQENITPSALGQKNASKKTLSTQHHQQNSATKNRHYKTKSLRSTRKYYLFCTPYARAQPRDAQRARTRARARPVHALCNRAG